jgi:hypothetical protein
MTFLRPAALGAGIASALLWPVASEIRLASATHPPTGAWERVPIKPRRATLLGLSFRPLQATALGLDPQQTLQALLAYPFHLLRLGAYWNRLEPEAGRFEPEELDRQIGAAERAGKQIILCVGAVKTFGYPEVFVPAHHLSRPLQEGARIDSPAYGALLSAATAFITRIVERYRDRRAILAWQVEHEAADPLGMEHSWRLATAFVQAEIAAVRAADPTRPILLNGFLPTSLVVRLSQWWRTRDQGDSLAVAQRLADIVGLDYYPRHVLVGLGSRAVYLDGSSSPWQGGRRKRLSAWARTHGQQVMVAEGQAEPWEAVTTPPNPRDREMYSCPPEQLIATYNQCMSWAEGGTGDLFAYLFWGAEYWVLRQQHGDDRYVRAFARILEHG